jgi:hypothetical protein
MNLQQKKTPLPHNEVYKDEVNPFFDPDKVLFIEEASLLRLFVLGVMFSVMTAFSSSTKCGAEYVFAVTCTASVGVTNLAPDNSLLTPASADSSSLTTDAAHVTVVAAVVDIAADMVSARDKEFSPYVSIDTVYPVSHASFSSTKLLLFF